jgi:large conductance mechanosensitive channel
MKERVKGFFDFIREQGVVGLAIGFILGGAVSKVVTSLVNDIINPLIGALLGKIGNLGSLAFHIGTSKIAIGSFISTFIDFSIIAAVVYFGFKGLKLDKLDKPKN